MKKKLKFPIENDEISPYIYGSLYNKTNVINSDIDIVIVYKD